MPLQGSVLKLSSYVLVAVAVASVGAVLAVQGARSEADAATAPIPGIGALRWGSSYATGSGYDRYAYVDVGIGDAAKAAAQPGTSLVYTSGTTVRDNWGGINTGVPLSEARANGWLLTTSSGDYVMNKAYGAYVADFGSSAYQRRWIDNVTGFLAQTGADGVHIDDVIADAPSLTGGVYPAKYPTQQAWEDAQVSFVSAVGSALRAKGYYVLVQANGRTSTATGYANDSAQTSVEFFSRLAPLVDGVMSEYWMETPADKLNPTLRPSGTSDWYQHWDEWLRLTDTVESRGADFFTLMYGSGSTTAGINAMRYARASFLLDWNGGGGALMFRTPDTGDAWNPEWTADVGTPTGAKYSVGSGWRRDFTAGTAIINPSSSTSQTFSLGGTYYKADGSAVSTVNLGPSQALVLRRTTATTTTAPPVNTSVPVLSGTAAVGSSLSSTTGQWSGAPTSYAYQWQRCDGSGSFCSNITGATTSSYKPVSADAGGTLRSVVKASNTGGSATAKSLPSAPIASTTPAVPTNVAVPLISGAPVVGSTLTSATGEWTGSPTSYAYQWQRCDTSGASCSNLSGATGVTYTVASGDLGATLRTVVTASNTAGSTSVNSLPTVPVTSTSVQTPFSVTSSIADGATISGSLAWTATVSGATVSRVEFSIDGTVRWTERTSPYVFNGDNKTLDTTTLSDGVHALRVTAFTSDGRSASTGASVKVANASPPPATPAPTTPAFAVASSIADGATIGGSLAWTATVSGATVSRVEFSIDGTVRWTEQTSPYVFNGDGKTFDTTTLTNGGHTLGVTAFASDGRSASATANVRVSNTTAEPTPVPGPTLAPFVVTSSIVDGSKLTGSVKWTATVGGGTAASVEFWIDGKLYWTEKTAPYVFNGDLKLFDTSTIGNGRHTLVVKATTSDGAVAYDKDEVNVVQ